jgi:hypothetical protein
VGDLVRLKNGSKFEGVVTRQTPDAIEMKITLQGEMTFPRSQIEKLGMASPMENLLIVERWEREARQRDQQVSSKELDRGTIDGEVDHVGPLVCCHAHECARCRPRVDRGGRENHEGRRLGVGPA